MGLGDPPQTVDARTPLKQIQPAPNVIQIWGRGIAGLSSTSGSDAELLQNTITAANDQDTIILNGTWLLGNDTMTSADIIVIDKGLHLRGGPNHLIIANTDRTKSTQGTYGGLPVTQNANGLFRVGENRATLGYAVVGPVANDVIGRDTATNAVEAAGTNAQYYIDVTVTDIDVIGAGDYASYVTYKFIEDGNRSQRETMRVSSVEEISHDPDALPVPTWVLRLHFDVQIINSSAPSTDTPKVEKVKWKVSSPWSIRDLRFQNAVGADNTGNCPDWTSGRSWVTGEGCTWPVSADPDSKTWIALKDLPNSTDAPGTNTTDWLEKPVYHTCTAVNALNAANGYIENLTCEGPGICGVGLYQCGNVHVSDCDFPDIFAPQDAVYQIIWDNYDCTFRNCRGNGSYHLWTTNGPDQHAWTTNHCCYFGDVVVRSSNATVGPHRIGAGMLYENIRIIGSYDDYRAGYDRYAANYNPRQGARPNYGAARINTTSDITGNQITIVQHQTVSGTACVYSQWGTAQDIGLTHGETYYVHAVDTSTITLHYTKGEGESGATPIPLTSGGDVIQLLHIHKLIDKQNAFRLRANFATVRSCKMSSMDIPNATSNNLIDDCLFDNVGAVMDGTDSTRGAPEATGILIEGNAGNVLRNNIFRFYGGSGSGSAINLNDDSVGNTWIIGNTFERCRIGVNCTDASGNIYVLSNTFIRDGISVGNPIGLGSIYSGSQFDKSLLKVQGNNCFGWSGNVGFQDANGPQTELENLWQAYNECGPQASFARFNGTDAYVQNNANWAVSMVGIDTHSVSLWYRCSNDSQQQSPFGSNISKGLSDYDKNNSYGFWFVGNDVPGRLLIYRRNGLTDISQNRYYLQADSVAELSDGDWHSLVITWSPTPSGQCFIDGVAVTLQDVTTDDDANNFAGVGPFMTPWQSRLPRIGCLNGPDDPNVGKFFDGDISDVGQWYNHALSLSEAQAIFNAGQHGDWAGVTDPTSRIPLDYRQGQDIIDAQYDASPSGTVVFMQDLY